MEFVFAVGVGLLVGLVLGSLGGGGGIITVPALVFLLGLPAHEATTASLVIVGVSSSVAVVSYARRGRVRYSMAVLFAALGVIGTTCGSVAARGVPESVLLGSFAVLLCCVAALMWRKAAGSSGAADNSESFQLVAFKPTFRVLWSRVALLVAAAIFVGFLIGFFGVGGGFAIVPALLLILGLPMTHAVGTSLLIVALMSTQTFVSKIFGGVDIVWPVVLVFTGAALVGSMLAPRWTANISGPTLTRSFAVLMVLVALSMGIGVAR